MESMHERVRRRHLLASLVDQFRHSRLHKLFIGFIKHRIHIAKERSLMTVARDDYNTVLVRKSLGALRRHSHIRHFVFNKLDQYMN